MKKYLEILKNCKLFDQVEDEDLLRMLNCLGAKIVEFDKKYTIFAEGSPARHVAVMLSGEAQMIQLDYYGNRSIIAEIRQGDVFLEAFACSETESLPISVISSEPSVVMLIDRSHILETCQNRCSFHNRLIFNLMKVLATKSIEFHSRMEITSKRTTREKLLTYLAMEAKKCSRDSFEIPFDRQELADYLEVDRSGLSAEIGKLKKEGVIDNRKNYFILL